jgi:hypothetical protein
VSLQINSFKKEVDGMFGSGEQDQVYLDDTPDVQYNKVPSSYGLSSAPEVDHMCFLHARSVIVLALLKRGMP